MKNWAGNVEFFPSEIQSPFSVEEIQASVKDAIRTDRKIRMVGSAHSFTPLMANNQILMNLDRLQGVISTRGNIAEVWGGTKLKRLGHELYERGLGMANLGDIDVQSIAGAASTGTHGTGSRLGVIATQIEEIEFINGLGDLMTCSKTQNPELLKAAAVSLGTLGIITKLKINTMPKYVLEMSQKKMLLEEVLDRFAEFNDEYRHFEFFWFPYSKYVLAKFTKITDQMPKPVNPIKSFYDNTVENVLFDAINKLARAVPPLAPAISQFEGWAGSVTERRDYSHKVFATERGVKFLEVEYGVPIGEFKETILTIQKVMKRDRHRVSFPVECRFVRGDDLWLSPANGRDSAFIAVHAYKGMPYLDYFAAMEKLLLNQGGRPHWGKMHTQNALDLSALYPRWNDFQRLRALLDPHNIFQSTYLEHLMQ